jgi:hypothetical protein
VRFYRRIRRRVIGNGMHTHSDQNGRNYNSKAVPQFHSRASKVERWKISKTCAME